MKNVLDIIEYYTKQKEDKPSTASTALSSSDDSKQTLNSKEK